MRVTRRRVERVYDALSKQENGDPYYSMTAIRLILKADGIRD